MCKKTVGNTRPPVTRRKFTPPMIARLWGVNRQKVLAWINTGQLKAIDANTRPGLRPRFLVDTDDLAAFEAARTVIPKGQ